MSILMDIQKNVQTSNQANVQEDKNDNPDVPKSMTTYMKLK